VRATLRGVLRGARSRGAVHAGVFTHSVSEANALEPEQGQTLIEMVIATALLAAVIALFAQAFVASTFSSGYAQLKEVAVTLADSAIDNARAVSPTSSLLTGSCITTAPAQVDLSQTYCTDPSTPGVYQYSSKITTLDSIPFTTTTFTGNCYLQASRCTLTPGTSPPMVRVIAKVTWAANSGCTNGTCYYVSSSLISSASDSILNTVLASAPTGVTATPGNAQVSISWTDPSSNGASPITSYDVYESTSAGGENDSGTPACTASGASATSCNVSGLTNGNTYYFTVEAVNSAGNSSPSTEVSTVPYTVPGAPTGLTATAGNALVSLSWTDPGSNGGSAITGYDVYEATTSGGENDSGTPACTASGASATGCTVSGLTHRAYYFIVEAVNAAGNSSPSSPEASATPTTAVISFSPTSATVGTTVTVSGTGFTGNGTISHTGGLNFNGTTVNVGSTTVHIASNGTWSSTFVVPNASNGAEGVTATDSSAVSASATFNVIANTTLSVSSANVGTTVTISGTGFTGGGLISHSSGVTFDGTNISVGSSSVSIASNGTWSSTFTVPNASNGSQTVNATDSSGVSDSANLTVTAQITLSPTSIRRGSTVTITGTGFTSGGTINHSTGVIFNGSYVSIGYSNIRIASNGTWTATFTVPSSSSTGSKTVSATDSSGASDSATLSVTS
jgi:type II secretory pathway pseudopilin PulG